MIVSTSPLCSIKYVHTTCIYLFIIHTVIHLLLDTQLPMGSAVQQMAMKCWCLQFQPEDQSFLIQSNVFANISTVLSNVEEVPENVDKKIKSSQPPSEKVWEVSVCLSVCLLVLTFLLLLQTTGVWLMQNVLSEGRLKPSSNDAMANSLTDGSTETFWESRDEPRSKTKALMVTFNDDKKVYAAAVHNDNGKDSGVCTVQCCICVWLTVFINHVH